MENPQALKFSEVFDSLSLPPGFSEEDRRKVMTVLDAEEPTGNFSRKSIYNLMSYCLSASRFIHVSSRDQK